MLLFTFMLSLSVLLVRVRLRVTFMLSLSVLLVRVRLSSQGQGQG